MYDVDKLLANVKKFVTTGLLGFIIFPNNKTDTFQNTSNLNSVNDLLDAIFGEYKKMVIVVATMFIITAMFLIYISYMSIYNLIPYHKLLNLFLTIFTGALWWGVLQIYYGWWCGYEMAPKKRIK